MKRLTLALTLLLISLGSPADDDRLQRVEPPFWWQGFENPELQLMVYGVGAGRLDVAVDYPGVRLDRLVRVENQNYLFVYLHIASDARPGNFDIVFSDDSGEWRQPYELRQKNPDLERTAGFDRADAIYLVTPDRFVNGDSGNDTIPEFGDSVDRADGCGRHGGDLQGLVDSLEYIDDMGFTAIWLNPIVENRQPVCSYHGYASTDFYSVDARYGSNEEYLQFVEQARERGIGVIMDMITNHVGDQHWWMKDLPTADWINLIDSPKVTNHIHATQQDPYASQHDLDHFEGGWFVVPGMPDLNQRNELLADYLVQNALWWVEYLGLAGIRMDTYPYNDKHFMTEWSRRVMEEYPHFNIVGEEWYGIPQFVAYWQRGKVNHDGYVSYLPSLMDFPLQEQMVNALVMDKAAYGSTWRPVYETLAQDVLYPDPFNLVIMPDNHDMNRIFTWVNEDYDLWRMAMVMMATMRGIPQIYYGTEILMHNRGFDGDHGVIRSDFPGGWADDERNAFTGEGLTAREREAQDFTRRLLNWRKGAEVIHHGRLMQFAPLDETYAYLRYTDSETVMVIFNKEPDGVEVDLARFAERLESKTAAYDVISGERFELGSTLDVPARGLRLLELR
jgi:glycosidase